MSKFKVGDKVVTPDGLQGIVTEIGDKGPYVTFIDKTRCYYHESNLELKERHWEVGDRVLYHNQNLGHPNSKANGRTGVITHIGAGKCYVAWDDGSKDVDAPRFANLQPAPPPSSEEIQKALAMLKAAGKVEFTPRKPPFGTITVAIGDGTYEAVVSDKCVTVGCQAITFAAVDAVAAAVSKARAYNNGDN